MSGTQLTEEMEQDLVLINDLEKYLGRSGGYERMQGILSKYIDTNTPLKKQTLNTYAFELTCRTGLNIFGDYGDRYYKEFNVFNSGFNEADGFVENMYGSEDYIKEFGSFLYNEANERFLESVRRTNSFEGLFEAKYQRFWDTNNSRGDPFHASVFRFNKFYFQGV